jgi:hypothetical protein
MAVDLAQIIPPLVRAKVDFILIGGMAAILHGSARVTFDVDLGYSRTDENIERLVAALAPHGPYARGVPGNLPFSLAKWQAVKLTVTFCHIHSKSKLSESALNVSIFQP